VPGATGLLIDNYGWTIESEEGMQFMLYRDFVGSKTDAEEDNDDEAEDDTRTPTSSSHKVAGSFVRAMYTAIIVLKREAHPRSTLCPLTTKEWLMLTKVYLIPEKCMKGEEERTSSEILVDASEVTHELDFLRYRSSERFFQDLWVRDAHFAVRAMHLALKNLSNSDLSAVQEEFVSVTLASSRSAQDQFDHALSVVHTLLTERSVQSTEVKQQLQRFNTARKRKQTARNLDSG
jgi:hypothetical protein